MIYFVTIWGNLSPFVVVNIVFIYVTVAAINLLLIFSSYLSICIITLTDSIRKFILP